MKKHYFFILITLLLLTLYSCKIQTQDKVHEDDEIIIPPIIYPDEDIIIETPETDESAKKYAKSISDCLFIDVKNVDNLTLPTSIFSYPIAWSYQEDIAIRNNNTITFKKNGFFELQYSITVGKQIVTNHHFVAIANKKIQYTIQHGLKINYAFISNNPTKIGNYMTPRKIVFHNTANTASAKNEVAWLNNTSNSTSTSFHFAVDDLEVYQAIPITYYAHHCGNLSINKESIGIEIAKSLSLDEKIKDKAIDNSCLLIKLLQATFNIKYENILTHKDANGKYCPHDIFDRYGLQNYYSKLQSLYV